MTTATATAAPTATATPSATVHPFAPLPLPDRPAIDGAVHIPLALLKPSPTNPRKAFDQAALQDLADSIKAHGLLQPILARPAAGARPGEALYEIVAGERRWRASQLAQLPSIMALVRSMTDFEVLEVQLVENLKRADLSELEEAEGYRALLRKPDGLQGYATVDDLAARIGKSRSYVFQRMKLLDLQDDGRAALAAGHISFSVALLIARLPSAADQAKATKDIVAGWGGDPYTYKQAEAYVHSTFHLELDRAAFPTTDATLLPAAGSCRTCAKRTGANPDLFQDVRKADTCTDGACYHQKEDAHRARQRADAEARGLDVITGKDARKIKPNSWTDLKGWLELDKVHHHLGNKPLRKLLGKKLPEVKLLEDPHSNTMVEVVREADAVALLKEAGVLKAAYADAAANRSTAASTAERDAERAARDEVAVRKALALAVTEAAAGNAGADAAFRRALLADVGVLLWTLLSADAEKRVEALLAWAHIGSSYTDKTAAARKADRIRALEDGAFARYLVAVLCATDMHVNAHTVKGSKPTVLLALADRLGVDAKAIREDLRQLQRHTPDQAAAARQQRKAAQADSTTPETALAGALKKATKQAQGRDIRYRDAATGATWSGRGLQPHWLKQRLADGAKLADFDIGTPPTQRPTSTLSDAARAPFRPQE